MSDATPDQDELLDVAREAAAAAAAELAHRFRGDGLEVRTKSTDTDPVSEADLAAEAAIREVLAERRPADAILGEEGGLTAGADGALSAGLRWVVDPLDGTVNYLYGIPQFAVSIAVEDEEGALAGVILNPVTGERYEGTRAGVARRVTPGSDAEPLAARGETRLEHALVGTGFGYDPAVRALQGQVAATLLPRVRDVRRAGAAALDLASCAAGQLDAYYERGVKPWDIAAGILLCERVGLRVRRLEPVAAGASSPDSVGLPEGIVVAPQEFIDDLVGLVSGRPV